MAVQRAVLEQSGGGSVDQAARLKRIIYSLQLVNFASHTRACISVSCIMSCFMFACEFVFGIGIEIRIGIVVASCCCVFGLQLAACSLQSCSN